MAAVNLVANQQNDSFATATQLTFLHEEGFEVIGTEGIATNPGSLLRGGSAGDKLDISNVVDGFVVAFRQWYWLD
jgi:hypothetical protein